MGFKFFDQSGAATFSHITLHFAIIGYSLAQRYYTRGKLVAAATSVSYITVV
jgi:hypothetical protein